MVNITDTLTERGVRYGKFEDHADIAQRLKQQMHATPGWKKLANDQREALDVIQHKVARILNGDPDYADNWHDIVGYAKLVDDRLQQETVTCDPSSGPITVVGSERYDACSMIGRTMLIDTGFTSKKMVVTGENRDYYIFGEGVGRQQWLKTSCTLAPVPCEDSNRHAM